MPARDHPPLRAATRAEDAEKTAAADRRRRARAPPRRARRADRDRPHRGDGRRRPLHRLRDLRLAGRAVRRGRRPPAGAHRLRAPRRGVAPADARDGVPRRPARGVARCSPPSATPGARCARWRSSTRRRSAARSSAGRTSGRRRWRGSRGQLHEQGHLRPEVTVEEANDVLWVITSFESFDLLYSGRGLPLDVVVERLTDAAERALAAAAPVEVLVLGLELVRGERRALRVGDHARPHPRRVERRARRPCRRAPPPWRRSRPRRRRPNATLHAALAVVRRPQARDDVDEAAGRAHLAEALAGARVELLEVVAVARQRPRRRRCPCRAGPSRRPRRRTPSRPRRRWWRGR